ncbi:MAG: glycosyltransferase [Cyanobacteria bacterium J06621_8]
MKITTIIPTYRRPHDLRRCLLALIHQVRPSDEIIVVIRDTDVDTRNFLEEFECKDIPLKIATISVSGVVAAMNLGLEKSIGDIVAFTDDDAVPHLDWLEKIEQCFLQDESIGGVGGRDWQYRDSRLLEANQATVGKLQWFGRVIGNHHIGFGEAREVDVLKGVNMSFRRDAIRGMSFDSRMKGTGAQVHFELAFCLTLRKTGWKLIYDPQIIVDHYPSQRFDEDQRRKFNEIAFFNAVHNETLALLEYLSPVRKVIFLFWSFLIGTRSSFGLLQFLRFLPQEGLIVAHKLIISTKGRWQGWLTLTRTELLKG